MLINAVLYGLPTFLAIYFGADIIRLVIDAIPSSIITGLAVGGGMIGAVGFALLLTTIKTKNMWPFFIIGFIFASYLKVNMIGIGLLSLALCGIYYQFVIKKSSQGN